MGQQATEVPAATGERQLPWTSPLHHREVIALSEVVRTATLLVTATVSGMRSSELMELKVGCRRLAGHFTSGLFRYRLAGTLVKGQPLGGTDEEWVVIEPVYRAVEVAEQLHGNPRNGALLFGPFNFRTRYGSFRELGERSRRAAARSALHSRPSGQPESPAKNTGDRAGLPAQRRPRQQDRPEKRQRRDQ